MSMPNHTNQKPQGGIELTRAATACFPVDRVPAQGIGLTPLSALAYLYLFCARSPADDEREVCALLTSYIVHYM
ncbi:uncharacterized protein SCHCODRAFT_02613797 [Schizophyllum commune H4-8]|uniref:uncharacterized protein n=1 Tax=Schizophyllum commune (strain H4-8 / FGSC 9210) TaxID=578458 RepID=UPI00215EC954|nr:uncharacterized protein SCHCODRAFT_02613797 [Schizophyllum commune H4-8]KAI5896010.1 hypothetical protein SCHCODRAFT_02613797 [Schizophyllum commune H4-8]